MTDAWGGPLRATDEELRALAVSRTARREEQCRRVYGGSLAPSKGQVMEVLQQQHAKYGVRLPDLGQRRADEVLARALVRSPHNPRPALFRCSLIARPTPIHTPPRRRA
jgi:hypothetical protein